jgi:hypothetical protein
LDRGVRSEVFELAHRKAAKHRESFAATGKTDIP